MNYMRYAKSTDTPNRKIRKGLRTKVFITNNKMKHAERKTKRAERKTGDVNA